MSTIHVIPVRRKIREWITLLLILLPLSLPSLGQGNSVMLNLILQPPFSPYFEDYFEYENKAMLMVTGVANPASGDYEIYFKGKLEGNNGILLMTQEGFKPGSPVTVPNGGSLMLTGSDLSPYFALENLQVTGIELIDLATGDGLPEGIYSVCFQAYDYATDQPVSGDYPAGCVTGLYIQHVDPPQIMTPFNDQVIVENPLQQLVISWNQPAGTPLNTLYHIAMAEVYEGISPDEAITGMLAPPFFETTVNQTTYLYGMADPPLQPGTRYALQIRAEDPAGKTTFRNDGASAIISFVYGQETGEEEDSTSGFDLFVFDSIRFPDVELVPPTVIKGQLYSKFPAQLQTMSFNTGFGSSSTGSFSYSGILNGGLTITGNSNLNHFSLFNSGISYQNPVLDALLGQVYSRGFLFEQTQNLSGARPLPNTRIKLVARVAMLQEGNEGGYPTYGKIVGSLVAGARDVNGDLIPPETSMRFINVVLAVAYTDSDGNYEFNFQAPYYTGELLFVVPDHPEEHQELYEDDPLGFLDWGMFQGEWNSFTQALGNQLGSQTSGGMQTMSLQTNLGGLGTIRRGYLCLKIEVDHPKLCSPDIDIFAMPGDVVQVPPQVSLIKSYNLGVTTRATGQTAQLVEANGPIAGVQVKIMRDTTKTAHELAHILQGEGQQLDSRTFTQDGGFKNVVIDHTQNDGTLFIPNLVYHYSDWDGASPYVVEVSTRDFEKTASAYDNTLYNYKTIWTLIPGEYFINKSLYPVEYGEYNHLFTPATLQVTYTMEPLAPEIKGRVMAASNIENIAMKGVRVDLFMQPTNKPLNSPADLPYNAVFAEKTIYTPDNGFFRFDQLSVFAGPGGSPAGPYRRLYITKNGYKPVIIPPYHLYPYNLPYGQLKDIKDVMLQAAEKMTVYVQDEAGNPVESYVRLQGGPWYKTNRIILFGNRPRELASIPVAHFANDIDVEPLSSQYFKETIHFNVVPQTQQALTVYRKMHRPVFSVKSEQGSPISGCRIEIAEFTLTTKSNGRDSVAFAAPENQFMVRILPPDGYAPKQLSMEIPVSRDFEEIVVILKADKQISGIVRNKKTAEPMSGVSLYSELVNTDGQSLYLEAKTGPDGRYTLRGIPAGARKLTVHASRAGNKPTFAGQVKTFDLLTVRRSGQQVSYDFELEPLEGWSISAIWGFPCVIEKFTPVGTPSGQSGERALISGYLSHLPGMGIFKEANEGQRYPFSNLLIKKEAGNAIQPVEDAFMLDVDEISVLVGETFTGALFSPKSIQLPNGQQVIGAARGPLRVERVMDGSSPKGKIAGALKLNLNSFRLAYDFKGNLYLGDQTNSYRVTVFGTHQAFTLTSYPVFDLSSLWTPKAIKEYTVFGFHAEAMLGESVFQNQQIRLKTILHTAIPGGGTGKTLDLALPAGEVIITKNNISFQSVPGQLLKFKLEEWQVESKQNWYFDKNEESVVLPEALILTGQGIDATVKGIRIKPTSIKEGELSLQGGLNLGGVAPLKIAAGLSPLFNYDSGIGHYRISLVGQSSGPAAWVENLPGLYNQRLEFSSVALLSNNENAISMQQVLKVEDLFYLETDQIMTGNGFFKMSGTPVTGIPGYNPVQAVLAFEKVNNQIVMHLEPLQGVVSCLGRVQFFLDQSTPAQELVKGRYTAYGTLRVSPDPAESGEPFEFRGFLTKTNSECKIEIIQVDPSGTKKGNRMQTLNLGAKKISIESGSTMVAGGDWGYLNFTGLTGDFAGIDGNANNKLNFTVYGAVKASSTNIALNNISTPLGKMEIDYNFDEPSLTGTLIINNANLGFARINNGLMGLRFDTYGYYLAFNGELALLEQGVGGGFIVGNSSNVKPEHIKPIIQGYQSGYIPQQLQQNRISGIYAIGKKPIIDKEFPIGITISAKAEAGPYVNMDFAQGGEYIVGGYIWARFKGGVSTEVCDMGICTGAMLDVHGGFKNGSLVAEACGVQAFDLELCLIEVSGSIVTRAFYDNGIKFSMSLGGGCGAAGGGPCN